MRRPSVGVATELAKAGKAELIVAHVWERPEGAQAVLDAAVAAAQEAGVKKVKGELHGGRSPADVLIDLAEDRDVGLVVVSGGRSRTEIGPTADRLSHRAPRDLLIAMDVERGDGERLYRRMLIATDGSATADRAARKGFDLAESVGAPVTLVFVGHPATGQPRHRRHGRGLRRGGRVRRRAATGRPGRGDPRRSPVRSGRTWS